MPYKPPGSVIDLWYEHVNAKVASFTAANGVMTDDWHHCAHVDAVPTRLARIHDTTAYPTKPQEESWYVRLNGSVSPADLTGSIRRGQPV